MRYTLSNADFGAQNMLGGYSARDGTIEFYGRINALLKAQDTVVDLGAGRASWFFDDPSPYSRSLRLLKGKVKQVIGLDVDDAVLQNPSTDQNLLLKGDRLPLADASVDTLIADYVLEHIQDPHAFEAEVFRVLKTGGIFCARTPHSWNYVSIGARLVRNKKHADVLAKMQPDRKVMDVFPTAYRANSMRAIRRLWPSDRWIDHSYLYSAEPKYHFGSRTIYRVFSVLHNLLPAPLVGNIFVFLVKR